MIRWYDGGRAWGGGILQNLSRGGDREVCYGARIAMLWPDMAGCSVVGHRLHRAVSAVWDGVAYRRIALTPAQIGTIRWPPDAPNLSCTAEEDVLPFPTWCSTAS